MPRSKRDALLWVALLGCVAAGCRERSSEVMTAPVVPDAGAAGAGAVGAADTRRVAPREERPVHIVYPPAPGEFVRLVQDAQRAVVNIRTTGTVTGGPASMYPNARPDPSLGSGFLIDREAGYVLTNLHIVERSSELRVRFPEGEERPAEIAGRAPHLDIALLRTSGGALPEDIQALALGESEGLEVGTWVLALGNPFGGEVTASAGILSSVGQTSSVYEPPQERFRSMLHTDASIHRGNTGGPLVDLTGAVVGVNLASRAGADLSFAIPISQVNRVFDQLRAGEVVETWLGVYVVAVTAANAGACAPEGVFVSQVVQASPAAKAGLRVGDIITGFDGQEVDEPKLAALARAARPGQRVEVAVCRAGEAITRPLSIEEKPR